MSQTPPTRARKHLGPSQSFRRLSTRALLRIAAHAQNGRSAGDVDDSDLVRFDSKEDPKFACRLQNVSIIVFVEFVRRLPDVGVIFPVLQAVKPRENFLSILFVKASQSNRYGWGLCKFHRLALFIADDLRAGLIRQFHC